MLVHGQGEMQYSGTMDGQSRATAETRSRVRAVLVAHAQLGEVVARIADEGDLYEAGMTSRASVSVMLALETEFAVEFPDAMLRRDVFQSITAIGAAIEKLLSAG